MPVSAIDAINPALDHTKQQLFKPFRIGQWARLALVGFFAGELSSGGCSGRTFRMPSGSGSSRSVPGLHFPHFPVVHLAAIALIIAVAIAVLMVLWILLIYLNSMMRFVLFDSIVFRECHIRQYWRGRNRAGLRYFVWQILFMLATGAGMTILIGIPAALALASGWLTHPREHMLALVLGGIFLFFVFMAFMLAVAVVAVLTKDFVVPQMALENVSAFEGWRRLLALMKMEKSAYAGYIGMKIVLAIVAGIALGIVTVIVMLILLIPAGGVGVAAVLIAKSAGITWGLYTITLAVVVACMALAILLFVMALISTPAIVFFPAYSIYFFAARYPALEAVIRPLPTPSRVPPFLANPEPAG
ncbi:MAG TPA: hypothetical protein VFA74_01355 [Terriglobales bacterium]|nr:hypothetical protein [Terriglobales bacterium]